MRDGAVQVQCLRLSCLLEEGGDERLALQELDVELAVVCGSEAIGAAEIARAVRHYVRVTAHENLEALATEIARVLATDFPVLEAAVEIRNGRRTASVRLTPGDFG
jgi:dihydroneopterin aldolase